MAFGNDLEEEPKNGNLTPRRQSAGTDSDDFYQSCSSDISEPDTQLPQLNSLVNIGLPPGPQGTKEAGFPLFSQLADGVIIDLGAQDTLIPRDGTGAHVMVPPIVAQPTQLQEECNQQLQEECNQQLQDNCIAAAPADDQNTNEEGRFKRLWQRIKPYVCCCVAVGNCVECCTSLVQCVGNVSEALE